MCIRDRYTFLLIFRDDHKCEVSKRNNLQVLAWQKKRDTVRLAALNFKNLHGKPQALCDYCPP